MAKKIRFFNVLFRDGHKEWREALPGQSKNALKAFLETEHLAIASIDFLGWKDVTIHFEDDDKQFYTFTVDGNRYDRQYGGYAFNFLDQEYRSDIINTDLSYMWEELDC